MVKIISATISIGLLVLADRAATEWHRLHDDGHAAAGKSGAPQLIEASGGAGSQGGSFTNAMSNNVINTDRL